MEGLEVRELDQLLHVIVIATVMLALMAIGLYGNDLHHHFEREATVAPGSEPVGAPMNQAHMLRALVSDLK